ncbi:MAG: chromosome segregation ATPase [Elainellaceae cyanobacterium]
MVRGKQPERHPQHPRRQPTQGSSSNRAPHKMTKGYSQKDLTVSRRGYSSSDSSGDAPRSFPGSKLVKTWQFWTIFGMAFITGIGGFSAALLFKIPALPNCPSIFWPTASASLRLYCAELAANKDTVDDLLQAIALVDGLPSDHPLRPEINRNIETWSNQILDLAQQTFHEGDLDSAVRISRRIPASTPAYSVVKERIERWQSVWAEAERIYQEAETAIFNEDLKGAFSTAVRLLSVGNRYWETIRYEELIALINTSREEGELLTQARRLARRGGVSNLLEAIKLAKDVDPDSHLYQAAQRAIAEFGKDLFALGTRALDRYDFNLALSVARQIPPEIDLRAETRDLTELALAQQQASHGTVSDLESAIIQAQRLGRDRPLYSEARQLVRRWQLEIQDVSRLQMARRMAEPGTVDDLRAAIAEAELIPRNNPRGDEAQEAIAKWTTEIQTTEDQPYLDRAIELARGGDVFSLEAAIEEARRIREGRVLYPQANRHITEWQAEIQRIQDRPYLVEARRLANQGNLTEAIATAEQIQPGRALSEDAQNEISRWRSQAQGDAQLQRAYDAATIPTPASLVSAIRLADQVPSDSPSRAEANRMINFWSQNILDVARSVASQDLEQAIAIAEMVPTRTDAYAAAQLQIETWSGQLSPNPVIPTVENSVSPTPER